jgi:hypothetical protein
MTATGGLHLNFLLSIAIGFACYCVDGTRDHVPKDVIIGAFLRTGPYLLAGYALAVLIDSRGRKPRGFRAEGTEREGNVGLMAVLTLLWMIGAATADLPFTMQSLGTILVIFKLLEYPTLTLAARAMNLKKFDTIIVLGLNTVAAFVFAFLSPWRSALVFVCAALALGFANRIHKLWPVAVVSASIALVVLPISALKKGSYEELMAKPVEMATGALADPIVDRVQSLIYFWSIRIDSAREIGFTEWATDAGKLVPRGGVAYWEAVEQLVPRVFWPDKPVFGWYSGYYVPRAIGLLYWQDTGTSWGLPLIPEFVSNFECGHLLWLIPLTFLCLQKLDLFCQKVIRGNRIRELLRLSLFFLFLSVMGIAFVVSYTLWLIIAAYIIGRYFARSRYRLTQSGGACAQAQP